MVGGRAEALDDFRVPPGIERGAGDDRLEEPGADAAGAGEAGQQPAGREQLEREQVDVLVGARGVAHLRRRGRELRRIEHHHVEPRAAVSQGPQLGKHVGFHEVDARRVERIRRQVLLRHLERRRRALDGGYPLRAAGQRGDGEAARVAEPVQHFAAGGERAHALPVLPLVEKEAGLLSLLDVDAEVEPVLDDGTARRGAVAAGEADSLLQALQCSYFGVRALEHRFAAGQLDQRVQDGLAPALDSGGKELHHQHVRIAIDHQARHAVGLAVHQPHRVRVPGGRKPLAHGQRARQPVAEKIGADGFIRVKAPHARPDLRLRAECRLRERLAGRIAHLDRVPRSRLAGDALDRPRENPRMAPPEGFLAAFLQLDHFFLARGWAAS